MPEQYDAAEWLQRISDEEEEPLDPAEMERIQRAVEDTALNDPWLRPWERRRLEGQRAARERRQPKPGRYVRFSLRLPRRLHEEASTHAAHEGMSLNTFLVAVVARAVGERSAGGGV